MPMELCGDLLLVILCLLAHAGLPVAAHSKSWCGHLLAAGKPRMVVASSTAWSFDSSRLCHHACSP